jgi:hypothetical protein
MELPQGCERSRRGLNLQSSLYSKPKKDIKSVHLISVKENHCENT